MATVATNARAASSSDMSIVDGASSTSSSSSTPATERFLASAASAVATHEHNKVQVKFTTKMPESMRLNASKAHAFELTSDPSALSAFVNKQLAAEGRPLATAKAFDFLFDGKILRTTLAVAMGDRVERLVTLEYVDAVDSEYLASTAGPQRRSARSLLDDTVDHLFDFELILANPAEELRLLGVSKADVPCKYFQRGSCPKGASCPQKHVKINDRQVVCKHWLRGLCKKSDACEFLHEYDLARMPICWFFSQYGECSNGECLYRHISLEDTVKDCAWFDRGFCRHGNKCRNKHVKRIACENYMLGFCPDGPSCKFGHPKFDVADGRPTLGAKNSSIVCHFCNEVGHKASDCPTHRDQRNTGKVVCYKCGKEGHYANNCNSMPSHGPRVRHATIASRPFG